ncbi:MAG: PGF-pre-PGF domain-containing protein [Nanoarchaeota archaeon]
MRQNKFLLTGILVLFGIIFLSMSLVSAAGAVTLNIPVASANISGTAYVLNATLDSNDGGALNLTRAWFLYSYVNGTNVSIASFVENVTDIGFNTTWNSAGTPDNATLTFWVIVARGNTTVSDGNTTDTSATVVVDNSAPTITLPWYVNGTIQNNTNVTINITLVDINVATTSACKVNVNGTNQTLDLTVISATLATCNTTNLSLKSMADGNNTIKVYANNSVGIWGQLITYVVFTDSNAPVVDLTATTIAKDSITLAITATDAGTGVASCTVDRSGATVSGTTSLTESSLNCGTSYTYVVTCVDSNGHAGDATGTYSTNSCGSGLPSTTGSTPQPSKVHSFAQMTPGVASIVKDFNADVGIKQIQIEVNNAAQNVKVSVTKYDGKPADVSISKSGKVYQYVQIDATNLADKLSKATVQFRVEKTWATTNNLAKEKIVVSKFDETGNKWNELTTTFASEDNTHYYYDVEVTSFSYFAIAEKLAASAGGVDTGDQGEEGAGAGGNLTWLWIVIVIAVIAGLIIWFVMKNKK